MGRIRVPSKTANNSGGIANIPIPPDNQSTYCKLY
jgi:hypothetical protein